jgi:hypothetical protein
VRTAAILTWVFAGLALIGFAATAVALVLAHDDLMDEIARRREYQELDLSRGELTAVLWVVIAVFALWAVCACVLAVLVWRGHNWARVLLGISGVATALFCLLTVPISVMHLVASAAVVGLLFSPASNQWFRARAAHRRPPPPAGPPSDPPSVW